jgi:adenylate kinase
MSDKNRAYIFFGRSGSGKGTQAKLLCDHLEEKTGRKSLYVETGARFREFMQGDSLSAHLTKEMLEQGGLMPEFLPIWLWSEVFVKNYTGEENLILDGLSRRLDEAPVLDSAMGFYKFSNPYVVYIDVSREKAFEMMKSRGRADDTDEYINERLDWFDEDVVPAVNYFKNNIKYNFISVNGEQGIDEVHKELVEKIENPKD